jgi:hypothetical protein
MKRSILALMALVLLVSCNKEEHPDANLHITGNIKGLKQGKIYIRKIVDTSLVTIDTIVFNGKSTFETHLKIDSPQMLYMYLDRGQTTSVDKNLPFFAEPGNMKIESSNEKFYFGAKITGSKNQELYEEFLKIKARFNNDNLDLVAKNFEATKNSNIKQLDSIAIKSDHLIKRRYLYTANFALNHAKNEIGPYIALSEIPDINIKYLDTIQKSMSPAIAKSFYGKMLTKHIADRKKDQTAELK